MTTHKDSPYVVLLTVNSHETQAVFDEFLGHGNTPTILAKDSVTYNDLGSHGDFRVIHTISRMGSGSIGAAQERTRQVIDHWHPQAIIAVGIAFGLDESKQKIGDVLISEQIQDYDLARINQNGSLIPRGDKASGSDMLCQRIKTIDESLKRSDKTWPNVRIGLLLSGQKLVDNLDYRESLKTLHPEAIGGEMEGYGLYVSATTAKTDWLVVKAICDWGHNKNRKKKEEWQRLAAKNAAKVIKLAITLGGGDTNTVKSSKPKQIAKLELTLDSTLEQFDESLFLNALASIGVNVSKIRIADIRSGSVIVLLDGDPPELIHLVDILTAGGSKFDLFVKQTNLLSASWESNGQFQSLNTASPKTQMNFDTTTRNVGLSLSQLDVLANLIAKDQLDEALVTLKKSPKATQDTIQDRLIKQSSRLTTNTQDYKEGTITRDEMRRERRQIGDALLGLARELYFVEHQTSTSVNSTSEVTNENLINTLTRFETITTKLTSHTTHEAIHGINNLKSITWIEQGFRAARSVCRVLVETPNGIKYGTGFLIASDRVMTNNHVINSLQEATKATIEFNYQLSLTENNSPTVRYRLAPNIYFKTSPSSQLDYSVIAIQPNPDHPLEQWGYLPLNPSAIPLASELVSIIQHPNAQVKQIVLNASVVIQVKSPRIHYTSDTMAGSSGSPVFNDLWQVIAIHHAAGPKVGNVSTNEGILMSAIVMEMGQNLSQVAATTEHEELNHQAIQELQQRAASELKPSPLLVSIFAKQLSLNFAEGQTSEEQCLNVVLAMVKLTLDGILQMIARTYGEVRKRPAEEQTPTTECLYRFCNTLFPTIFRPDDIARLHTQLKNGTAIISLPVHQTTTVEAMMASYDARPMLFHTPQNAEDAKKNFRPKFMLPKPPLAGIKNSTDQFVKDFIQQLALRFPNQSEAQLSEEQIIAAINTKLENDQIIENKRHYFVVITPNDEQVAQKRSEAFSLLKGYFPPIEFIVLAPPPKAEVAQEAKMADLLIRLACQTAGLVYDA